MNYSNLRGRNDFYANGPFDCDTVISSVKEEEIELCPDCNKMERDCGCPWEEVHE